MDAGYHAAISANSSTGTACHAHNAYGLIIGECLESASRHIRNQNFRVQSSGKGRTDELGIFGILVVGFGYLKEMDSVSSVIACAGRQEDKLGVLVTTVPCLRVHGGPIGLRYSDELAVYEIARVEWRFSVE